MPLKKIIILLLLLGVGPLSQAQQDSLASIVGSARYQDGEVLLRWSVNDASTFFALVQHGYQLERYELNDKGVPKMSTKFTHDVRPFSYADAQLICEKNPDNAYIWTAANTLFGSRNTNKQQGLDLFAKAIEQENLFTFAVISADMDSLAARLLGLRYSDRHIEKGRQYIYLIKPGSSYKKQALHFASILVETNDQPLLQPEILHIIEEENQITIQWSRMMHSPSFSAYWIERSRDGSNYQRINEHPFLGGQTDDFSSDIYSYSCSAENYTKYHYRIIGISPFAEESMPSKSFIAQAKDRTPPAPVTEMSTAFITEDLIQISWSPVKDKDLEQYHVLHSLEYNAPYKTIATKDKKASPEHTFNVNPKHQRHFFKVLTVDTANNHRSSHIITLTREDSIPPAPPTNVSASVDTNGLVSISWDQNHEEDLKGYFVHFANSSKHFFTNLNPSHLKENFYIDTISLRSYTKEIYYRVVAIDYNNNYSEYSETYQLRRPDIVPPQPSVFHTKKITNDGILLGWHNSNSPDFIKNKLYRKSSEDDWILLQELQPDIKQFTDTNISPGKSYHYRLIAVDDAGLEAKVAFDYGIINQRTDDIPAPTINNIRYSPEENIVILNFATTGNRRHRVYRSNTNNQYETLGYIENGQTTYIDRRITKGEEYSYRMMAIAEDGRKSALGKASTIEIKPNTQ